MTTWIIIWISCAIVNAGMMSNDAMRMHDRDPKTFLNIMGLLVAFSLLAATGPVMTLARIGQWMDKLIFKS